MINKVPITVIPTRTALHIGRKLARFEGFDIQTPAGNKDGDRLFPDGEVYTRLPGASSISGRTVVLHSGAPHPNRGLVELKMILDILRDNGVKRPEVFFLYFPYGMQDGKWLDGDTNIAEGLVKELTGYYKVKHIYAVDPHFFKRRWRHRYPITPVKLSPLLREFAKDRYRGAVFLVPDRGAQILTGLHGTGKTRGGVHKTSIISDAKFRRLVKGKTVGAVDDLLETGGTMESFYRECRKCGAKEVFAVITHGVLTKGIDRVRGLYSDLYLSNTINRRAANYDVTDAVAEALMDG